MRKILLIAAVLFSLGSMAQRPISFNQNFKKFGNNIKVNTEMSSMPSEILNKKAKAPAKAPEGEAKTYYLDFYNYCYGYTIAPEIHKAINIVYGDNNKVYIKNMMNPSIFDTYIEGDLEGNVITIKNGQAIGELQGKNYVLCNMAVDSKGQISTDETSDFKLTIDENYGIIASAEDGFIGIVAADNYNYIFTVAGIMQFVPENLFPAADEHEYTYDYEAYGIPKQTNKKSTVQIINLGEISYVKGLMPENTPDTWMLFENVDGVLTMTLPQNISEDVAAGFIDFNNNGTIIYDPVEFKYDAVSDTYKMSQYSLTDLFINQSQSLSYSEKYDNLRIKKTTTGINKVEGNDADVVSTEYFDLSGRRISNAQKGINVKVMKFSDGTTKTVKVIK